MNADYLSSQIAEVLIFHGESTASKIARRLGAKRDEVIVRLESLRAEGQVGRNGAIGDCVCKRCDVEWLESEPGDSCELNYCPGRLVDDCYWVFCGGPISKAWATA